MVVPHAELNRFILAQPFVACHYCGSHEDEVRLLSGGEPVHVACLQRAMGAVDSLPGGEKFLDLRHGRLDFSQRPKRGR